MRIRRLERIHGRLENFQPPPRPTAIGLEKGTEANQPLALAVVGGLTSSTILSLFLVPVMFMLFAKRSVATDELDAPATPGPASPAHDVQQAHA